MVERIKALCKQNNITIQKLEKELGFGNGTIRRWDTTKPASEKVSAVASFFGVTVEYIQDSEQKQPAGFGELSTGEINLIEAFRDIPDAEKQTFLRMIQQYVKHTP